MNIKQIKLEQIKSKYNTELSGQERILYLKKLKSAIICNEHLFYDALTKDLNKSKKEAYLSEISEVINEIDYHIKNIKKWIKPKRVKKTYETYFCKSMLIPKRKGRVLIISPFNYPIYLLFCPLIGAISGSNQVLLKLSEQTPYTNKVIYKVINEVFEKDHVNYIDLNKLKNYDEIYDYEPNLIFFTGSTKVGNIIAKKCVEKGIEYITELGGKCPCIIQDIKHEACYKRIVWSKFLNGGQTCVSINHIIYNPSIKDFIPNLIKEIKHQYPDPIQNKNMPRIINESSYKRLKKIIIENKKNIVYGGRFDDDSLMIEPTLIKVDERTIINHDELFGPILFICEGSVNLSNNIAIANRIDKSPLAAYLFSNNKQLVNLFVNSINAGGYAINDPISHILNHNLPFGGVYTSGFGSYHGKYSFDAFTFTKPVVINQSSIELPIKFINNKFSLDQIKRLISIIRKLVK